MGLAREGRAVWAEREAHVGALSGGGRDAGGNGTSADLGGAWHGPRESISPALCPLPHTPACYLTAAEIRGSPGGPQWPGDPHRAPPWSGGSAAGVYSSVAKPPESVESETGRSPFSALVASCSVVHWVPFCGRLCFERAAVRLLATSALGHCRRSRLPGNSQAMLLRAPSTCL